MRVLSKIQSSLSELTFMHAGLITARSIPLRRGSFFMNAARTNHKEAALSLCAPSNVCNSLSLSHSHYMRESLMRAEQYHWARCVARSTQDKTRIMNDEAMNFERPRDTDFLINILY
jgi:hypothetical protein